MRRTEEAGETGAFATARGARADLAAGKRRIFGRERKLRDALWDHKVVEWETGLHRITKEIRSALGDDARKPRFIETVARRGYRFCASIEPAEVGGNAQLRVNRVKWFLAGIFAVPGMVLTFCLAVGIAG